jgi:DNA polymerase III subunit epsilon
MRQWLRRWRGGQVAPAAADARRWIVLDVETSGLDMHHDRLLAIAAIALHLDDDGAPRVALADSFESVLKPDDGLSLPADKDNILLHGIGVAEQRAAAPAPAVLAAFEQWIGRSPLIAFHARFDETMIERATQRALGRTLANPWLDLEPVAATLVPRMDNRALDDWLDHFGIECHPRHQAAADTLATAELLMRLWPAMRSHRCTDFASLVRLAEGRRWLGAR